MSSFTMIYVSENDSLLLLDMKDEYCLLGSYN